MPTTIRALFRGVLVATSAVACRLDQPSSPSSTGPAELAQIVLAPAAATLAAGTSQEFTAYGRTASGDSAATTVSFSATGGTVTDGGLYTAGQTAGAFLVIATSTAMNLADTSFVTIDSTPLAQLILVPALAAVAVGGTLQFQAYGRTTTGDSVTAQVTYSATGGTITSPAGRYSAGSTPGTFQVIATADGGGFADTSIVSITGPSEVAVYPGQSIQSAVNANPVGTTFALKAGVHHGQTVIPKSGDRFIGDSGAVMDGDSVTTFAFKTGSVPYPSNVEIRNLVIRRYVPGLQMGAIEAGGPTRGESSHGWVVADCEIAYNGGAGVRTGATMQLLRNHIHHNYQIGFVGFADSAVVDGNEIDHNNWLKGVSFGFEAGGSKVVQSRGTVIRNNYSHDNWGPGLWTDGDNVDVLYEGNRVEDNAAAGIFHEISWHATIRNNIVQRNGYADANWYYGAGILISTSADVEVYGNTVVDNARGIIGLEQSRGTSPLTGGIWELRNLYVHDNDVTMTVAMTDCCSHNDVSGVAQDVGDLIYFTGKGNRFDHDTYHLGGAAHYFTWMNQEVGEVVWTGTYGQDVSGTFVR